MASEASVKIKADTSGFERGLKTVKQGLASLAKGLGITVVDFGLEGIGKGIRAFANLETSIFRVNSLFGGASKYVTYFAENTAKSFGLSESSAYQYAATFGTLFKRITADSAENSKVTIAMLKASSVIVSKTGRTMDDVTGRIRSGLRGDANAVSDLGIDISSSALEATTAFKNMAKGRSWAELNTYEQQQVRTLAILEQAHRNFGDQVQQGSAFSINELSVAFQDLQTSAGQFFNAGIQPIIQGLAKLVQWATAGLKALAVLFGLNTMMSDTSATDAQIDAQTALANETKATAKTLKRVIASFDVFHDITQPDENKSSAGSSPGDSPFAGVEPPEFDGGGDTSWLDNLSQSLSRVKDLLDPTVSALKNLWSSLEQLQSFAAAGLKDLYDKFLQPVGSWVLGEGLPRLINALQMMMASINWETINEGLSRLWDVLTPFAVEVGKGLAWFWENVLVPIGTWVMNDLVPAFLDSLAVVLEALNPLIEAAKPGLLWLWEHLLQPIGAWLGGEIIDNMKKWADEIVRIFGVMTQFFDLFGRFSLVIATLAFSILLVPQSFSLVMLAITAIIAAGALLIENWDAIKAKAVEILERIQEVFTQIGEFFVGLWKGVEEGFAKTCESFVKLWDGVKDAFAQIGKFITDLWDGVKRAFVSFINFIVDRINWLISGFLVPINALISGWNSTIGKLAGKIPTITLAIPKIPQLQAGGAVYGQIAAIIGDNFNARQDPEVVAPLSSLKGMILEALLQKDIAAGGNRETRVTLTLENGETLVDLLIDPMNNKAKNLGYAPVFKPAT